MIFTIDSAIWGHFWVKQAIGVFVFLVGFCTLAGGTGNRRIIGGKEKRTLAARETLSGAEHQIGRLKEIGLEEASCHLVLGHNFLTEHRDSTFSSSFDKGVYADWGMI